MTYPRLRLLTLKFNTATGIFLKIEMRQIAYPNDEKIKGHDMLLKFNMGHESILNATWDINCYVTCDMTIS